MAFTLILLVKIRLEINVMSNDLLIKSSSKIITFGGIARGGKLWYDTKTLNNLPRGKHLFPSCVVYWLAIVVKTNCSEDTKSVFWSHLACDAI
jgi:hypothetical protein